MNSSTRNLKRSALCDITDFINCPNDGLGDVSERENDGTFDAQHWLPIQSNEANDIVEVRPAQFITQNVHPYLARYQDNLKTKYLSHSDISRILSPDNELEMLHLLQETGVVAAFQQCEFCGGAMHFQKLSNTWYWICTRRFNGEKCNKGKFAVRKGTFFDNSRLSISTIMWIVWHFLHHLSEEQCRQYTNIGQKNCNMLVKYYSKCREVCGTWIWANKPKLGGFGTIVEMDESHFAGAQKYGKGRILGADPWKDWHKWVFGMSLRGSLDCVLKSVDSSRSRSIVIPIINDNCSDGTIFCSDGWKAYANLSDHVHLEDTSIFSVNHTKNYVDPQTGAHTQSIERLWRECKNYLPRYGLKPKDLDSYLSAFMWLRYVKQRKLDLLKHFLTCSSFCHPPTLSRLPDATLVLKPSSNAKRACLDDNDS